MILFLAVHTGAAAHQAGNRVSGPHRVNHASHLAGASLRKRQGWAHSRRDLMHLHGAIIGYITAEPAATHLTHHIPLLIEIPQNRQFASLHIISMWSLQNFAHVTTAMLSWHVQNFVVIWSTIIKLQQNIFTIQLEKCVKNHECDGSWVSCRNYIISDGSSTNYASHLRQRPSRNASFIIEPLSNNYRKEVTSTSLTIFWEWNLQKNDWRWFSQQCRDQLWEWKLMKYDQHDFFIS